VIATLADHARRAADALERDLTRRLAAIRGPLVPPPDGAGRREIAQ